MRVLDLFAGLRGWSGAFRDRGHDVRTLDLDPRFDADYPVDILTWDPSDLPWRPDIVLASPPCEGFSVLTIGRNWTRPTDRPAHAPKTDQARLALAIVEATRKVIADLGPRFFVIENPRAKLRRLPVLADLERRTVTYCRYGDRFMKPTDLWGGFPPSLELEPPCETRGGAIVEVDGLPYVVDRYGRPCHISAPRGSRTGIQGDGVLGSSRIRSRSTRGGLSAQKDVTRRAHGTTDQSTLAALRAKIPSDLALAVCLAAERDLEGPDGPAPTSLLDLL